MKKKILVIDDEDLLTKTLTKLLELKGFDVLVCKSVGDAEIILDEEDFDLILTDIKMPGLNGVDGVDRYRLKGINTPVIFISGYANPDLEERAKAISPDGYCQKPFDMVDLLKKIETMVL